MIKLTVILLIIALSLVLVFGVTYATSMANVLILVLVIILWLKHSGLTTLASIIGFSAGAVILSFAIALLFIASELHTNEQDSHYDYVLVLGAGLKGTEVSNTLKRRLDTALTVLHNDRHTRAVLSGGLAPGAKLSEAEAMARYLTANGIGRERLLLENQSTTTLENITLSREIVSYETTNPRFLIVTSDYHMYRAKLIARQQGIDAAG